MVRPGGIEPPRDLSHSILSAVRLPVPPWSHFVSYFDKLLFIFQPFYDNIVI